MLQLPVLVVVLKLITAQRDSQDSDKQKPARPISTKTLIKQRGQLTSAGSATNKLYPLDS